MHNTTAVNYKTERGVLGNVEYFFAGPPGTACAEGEFITESWMCSEAISVIHRLYSMSGPYIDTRDSTNGQGCFLLPTGVLLFKKESTVNTDITIDETFTNVCMRRQYQCLLLNLSFLEPSTAQSPHSNSLILDLCIVFACSDVDEATEGNPIPKGQFR